MTGRGAEGEKSGARKALRVASGVVVVGLVAVLFATGFLVSTRTGAEWMIRVVAPSTLTVDRIGGRLLGPLDLEGVRILAPWGEVRVERVGIEWRPGRLLGRELRLTRIRARAVELVRSAPTSGDRDGPPEAPSFALPLAVVIDDLKVEGLSVRSPENVEEMRVSDAALAARISDRQLRIDTLALAAIRPRGGRLELAGTGDFNGRAPHPLSFSLRWNGELPDGRPVEGDGEVGGDLSRMRIDHRHSRPVSLRLEGRVREVLTRPDWHARAELSRTSIRTLLPDGPEGTVEAMVSARGSADSVSARIDGSVERPGLDRVDLGGRMTADGKRLVVEDARATLAGSDTEVGAAGVVEMVDGEPSGRIEAEWSALRWPLSGEDEAFRSPTGDLVLEGSRSGFDVWMAAVASASGVPPSRLRLRARGSGADGLALEGELSAEIDQGERIEAVFDVEADSAAYRLRRLRATVAGTDASLELAGQVEPGAVPRVDLRGRWSNLRYPLRSDSAWTSPDGWVRLAGTASAFAAEMEGTLTRPGHSPVEWKVGGEGNVRGKFLGVDTHFSGKAEGKAAVRGSGRLSRTPPDSLFRLRMTADVVGDRIPAAEVVLGGSVSPGEMVLDSLRLETLDGRIRGEGKLTREAGSEWTIRLQGRDLDPGVHVAGWPGRLDLDVEARGSREDGGMRGRVTVSRLEGTLRERTVLAALDARVDRGTVDVDTLTIRSGSGRLALGGRIGPRWSLGWTFGAEELTDVHPAVSGSLESGGRIEGPVDSLRIEAAANGADLAAGGTSVGGFDLFVDLDLGGRSPSSVRADLRRLVAGVVESDSVRVRARGRPERHTVEVEGFWGADRFDLRASGGGTDGGWRGALDRLDFRSERAGRWSLVDPTALWAGPDSASLEELCWTGPTGRACASGSWSRAGGTAWTASSRGIPLAFFAPLLPPGVEAEGAISLESRGRLPHGEAPAGEATLEIEPGIVRYRLGDGTAIERSFERFWLEASAVGGDIEAEADIRVDDLVSLEGRLRSSLTGPDTARALRGRLGFQVDDGGLLGAVLEGISETGGRLTGQVEVGGTVADPRVRARADIEEGGATVDPLGVRITGGRLAVRPDGAANRWTYEGSARSGQGSATTSGGLRFVPDSLGWSVDSRLTGNRFEVFRTALGHVLLSPDIRIRASPERVEITGEVHVPSARLTARRLEPTVATSTDVVVTGGGAVGEEEGETEVSVPPIVSGRVSVVLGDDVGLDALGIRGDLEGTLLISADPGRLPTASGELRIVRGSYTAYRQTLQIERGRLLYANSPLDDPNLDLRITRRARDVLAGMNVTGSARSPTVSLFSEPFLADQEILAYLVTGRPLTGLSQGEGRVVESLARSVGISGGSLVLARLGMMFGLEHARVEAGPGGRGASVVVGQQLLPRLEVDYAIGLLGAPNVVRLRYRLGRGWFLQSESGHETGADLVYVLEER